MYMINREHVEYQSYSAHEFTNFSLNKERDKHLFLSFYF